MGAITNVPEVINHFNAYHNGTVLVGVTGSVTLPNLEAITEEVGGAGILGTYETSIPGFYSSISQEIPFRIEPVGTGRPDVPGGGAVHGEIHGSAGL